ncbi:flocculation protein FLO11-like [Pecten maximus]|uniref:flocculation protein FLO11-like n=1 Tax=Pecten maximus TaxID=6579 RepID=UPI001458EF54|nr:flocculation protein FLO11-like [Pecten maximus]
MATKVCDESDDTVSKVTEVCDDEESIVTNTTRNSEDNDDRFLFGLQMLENSRIQQVDVTDKTLSPVLPVQSPIWRYKVKEATDLSDVENSDRDSVISESLLGHTGLNCAQHIDSRNISESQMSQLLFDDTQSSCTQSEILPMQYVKAEYHHSTGSTKSLTQYNSPNANTQSHLSGTTGSQTEDLGITSGDKDFHPGISQSSEDTDVQPTKEFHLCSGQNSEEIDGQTTNVIQSDVTRNLRVNNSEPVNVANASSGDHAISTPSISTQSFGVKGKGTSPISTQSSGVKGKGASPSSTQSSGVKGKGTSASSTQSSGVKVKGTPASSTRSSGVVQEKKKRVISSDQSSAVQRERTSTRSIRNSGNIDGYQVSVFHQGQTGSLARRVKEKCRILDADQEHLSGESPRKSKRINTEAVADGEQKKRTFTSQKENASQSSLSTHETSPIATEHEREETIFRKIVKQQDYVDKQLRKSYLRDVDKLKQHLETLQSLLRKLSDQQKSERHRLTADVRARSKTKQDRLRYKSEIEQLGKRQRQLIQLVQRQKTLSSKLKDMEHPNNDLEYPITTGSLPEKSQHLESQMTGSSQITVTPSRGKGNTNA